MAPATRIPRIFHFIFGLGRRRPRFHLVHYLCLRSCIEVNDPDAVVVHYHREPRGRYWELIRPEISTARIEPVPFVSGFRYGGGGASRYRYAHHSDFRRLEILHGDGGVYADIDTLFVNPLPSELFEKSFVIGREPDITRFPTDGVAPSLCNALLMAEPGARFARLWLDQIEASFDGTWSAHSTLLPERLSREHEALVHIEPQRSFFKHAWTPDGIRTLLEGCDADLEGVLSMHLWAHLWWSRWRRDFTRFHAGMLDEDYIRRGETTYARAARRFLPR
ncbi:MAG: glycosyltransferase [Solirubrobacterales bacterium]